MGVIGVNKSGCAGQCQWELEGTVYTGQRGEMFDNLVYIVRGCLTGVT